MTRSDCAGCRDDYYNSGDRKCWSFDTAKVKTRFRIHRDTPCSRPGAYVKVRAPSCKHGAPYFYVDKKPRSAK